jgi:triacylglycerol esterase/lipase EstA (alpha/beta hydrolase family)
MDRAQEWLHEIERIRREADAEKVHLVGHSQGGLDGRVLIAPNRPAQDTPNGPLMGLGYGPHVASLTTIGTPHCGTVLVDELEESEPREREAMEGLLDFISIAARIFTCDPQDAVAAVKAMSRDYMREYFNAIIQEPSEVPCYAMAGDPANPERVNPLMRSSYESLLKMGPEEGGGPNDGFVTLESALFGNMPEAYVAEERESLRYSEEPRPNWQVLGVVSADHIAEVGMPLQFPANEEYDHLACFAGFAQFLDPGYVAEMTLERSGRWARRLKSAPPSAGEKTKARAKG